MNIGWMELSVIITAHDLVHVRSVNANPFSYILHAMLSVGQANLVNFSWKHRLEAKVLGYSEAAPSEAETLAL